MISNSISSLLLYQPCFLLLETRCLNVSQKATSFSWFHIANLKIPPIEFVSNRCESNKIEDDLIDREPSMTGVPKIEANSMKLDSVKINQEQQKSDTNSLEWQRLVTMNNFYHLKYTSSKTTLHPYYVKIVKISAYSMKRAEEIVHERNRWIKDFMWESFKVIHTWEYSSLSTSSWKRFLKKGLMDCVSFCNSLNMKEEGINELVSTSGSCTKILINGLSLWSALNDL